MVVSADAQDAICTEGTGIQGVDVTVDCKQDTCSFDEMIAAHAHWSVVGNCHQDDETSRESSLWLTPINASATLVKTTTRSWPARTRAMQSYYTVTVDCQF